MAFLSIVFYFSEWLSLVAFIQLFYPLFLSSTTVPPKKFTFLLFSRKTSIFSLLEKCRAIISICKNHVTTL